MSPLGFYILMGHQHVQRAMCSRRLEWSIGALETAAGTGIAAYVCSPSSGLAGVFDGH
jgi:hypothetical protein